MKITQASWNEFVSKLSQVNKMAGNAVGAYIENNGLSDIDALITYAFYVAQYFGTAAASLAATIYDAVVDSEGKHYPPAEMAEGPTYGDVAKQVYGTLKHSQNPEELKGAVSRLVKLQGQDTLLNNAIRDKAEFAWIPSGDSCPFCIMLASNGWRPISKKALKKGHAEHIHANCDCTYMIRHSKDFEVEGYDPEAYRKIYYQAKGNTGEEKINYMRRMQRQLVSNKTTNLQDEFIGNSVGAKSWNYDIIELSTGEVYHLAEGTYLQDKEVFAGKGTNVEYRNAYKYADKYGGKVENWQHVKAKGILSTNDGDRKAEVHWSQCENIGKKDMFIKKWMD